jgi:hypothetical protein
MNQVYPDISRDKTFTDVKYGAEVVVQWVNDNIVLLQETETGNKRLCEKEEFLTNRGRFLPTND